MCGWGDLGCWAGHTQASWTPGKAQGFVHTATSHACVVEVSVCCIGVALLPPVTPLFALIQ